MYYIRYFEAFTLIQLDRREEATPILEGIVSFVRSEYSPYMGPEVDYYIAASHRLLGDEVTARLHMSRKVMEWESELESDLDRKPPATAVYISYIDDWAQWHKSTMLNALAYSRLFFNDSAGAGEYFASSLKLCPDNIKAKFECVLLNE